MCGYVYDEEKEGVKFADLPEGWTCVCGAPKSLFDVVEETAPAGAADSARSGAVGGGAGTAEDYIKHLVMNGTALIGSGPTEVRLPSWEEILVMAGQLARAPLFDDEEVKTQTVIGKGAKKPLTIEMPVIISHMSYGALSGEAKVALAKGAAAVGTASSSGEGGIYPDEKAAAGKFIFEYVPNLYSVTDENLRAVDAIEIKIGQSAKPGMGGHLPAEKVTAEIAKLRGFPAGEDIISPSHFERLKTKEDLKELVEELRKRSGGRPIGVKLAANHVEEDLAFVDFAGADFVTIDGRGGSTGAAPVSLRDAAGVPTIYALFRARRWLDEHGSELDLIITGGFRAPSEMAKALMMGADVVAVATGALVAMGAGGELSVAEKVANYLRGVNSEIQMFARVMGRRSVQEFEVGDLGTTSGEIARYGGVRHV
jgi:glutamate synthase domain-containing protein 2/rubredoxin